MILTAILANIFLAKYQIQYDNFCDYLKNMMYCMCGNIKYISENESEDTDVWILKSGSGFCWLQK